MARLRTKRIGNAAAMLPPDWPQAFPHVVLMISVVNQEEADRDIQKLLATPAAWRGLSMEPPLGPVNLKFPTMRQAHEDAAGMGLDPMFFSMNKIDPDQRTGNGISWCIVGGESGHGARPMHPDWPKIDSRPVHRSEGVFPLQTMGRMATAHSEGRRKPRRRRSPPGA